MDRAAPTAAARAERPLRRRRSAHPRARVARLAHGAAHSSDAATSSGDGVSAGPAASRSLVRDVQGRPGRPLAQRAARRLATLCSNGARCRSRRAEGSGQAGATAGGVTLHTLANAARAAATAVHAPAHGASCPGAGRPVQGGRVIALASAPNATPRHAADRRPAPLTLIHPQVGRHRTRAASAARQRHRWRASGKLAQPSD